MSGLTDLYRLAGREFSVGFVASNAAIALELYKTTGELSEESRVNIKDALEFIEKVIAGCDLILKKERSSRDDSIQTVIFYNRVNAMFCQYDEFASDKLSLITPTSIKEFMQAIHITLGNLYCYGHPTIEAERLEEVKVFFKYLTKNSIHRCANLIQKLR